MNKPVNRQDSGQLSIAFEFMGTDFKRTRDALPAVIPIALTREYVRPHLMIIDDADEQLLMMRAVFKIASPALEIVTETSGEAALKTLSACLKSHETVS